MHARPHRKFSPEVDNRGRPDEDRDHVRSPIHPSGSLLSRPEERRPCGGSSLAESKTRGESGALHPNLVVVDLPCKGAEFELFLAVVERTESGGAEPSYWDGRWGAEDYKMIEVAAFSSHSLLLLSCISLSTIQVNDTQTTASAWVALDDSHPSLPKLPIDAEEELIPEDFFEGKRLPFLPLRRAQVLK